MGWFEVQISVNLGTDVATARYRDLDDAVYGYAAGSSWIDLGDVGQGTTYVDSIDGVNVWLRTPTVNYLTDGGFADNINLPVPEPVTLALLSVGVLFALLRRRR